MELVNHPVERSVCCVLQATLSGPLYRKMGIHEVS